MFLWDDRAIETLKTHWLAGVPAGKIAEELGAPSKNSVIGKAGRIGLPPHINAKGRRTGAQARHWNRMTFLKKASQSPKTKAAIEKAGGADAWVERHISAPPKLIATPLPKPRADLPPAVARFSFQDLPDNGCRWPVGDPRSPEFGFCGEPKMLGHSYCPTCAQRAVKQKDAA